MVVPTRSVRCTRAVAMMRPSKRPIGWLRPSGAMVRSAMAELMFGASEVLVPAKAMVNGEDIRIDPCPRVDYVHVLLPAHHIVMAEGAACESLLPGEVARNRADLPRRVAHRRYAPARPILSYAEAIALLGTGPDPAVRRCGARRARVKGPAL